MISKTTSFSRQAGALLLVGTVLGGTAFPAFAQTAPDQQPAPSTPAPAPAPEAATATAAPAGQTQGVIRSIRVHGSQRLEPETVRAYANLNPGQTYTRTTLDQAVKDLYATGLFADATISGTETGDLVINVR